MANHLKNLPAKERIKMLKELEAQKKGEVEEAKRKLQELEIEKKKELEETSRLIRESIEEVNEEDKQKRLIPIPEVARENTEENSTEISEEAKIIIRKVKQTPVKKETVQTSPEVSEKKTTTLSLEETVTQESPAPISPNIQYPHQIAREIENAEYRVQLHETPMIYLREKMENIYRTVRDRGYMLWEEHQLASDLAQAVDRKIQDIHTGNYMPGDTLAEKIEEEALTTKKIEKSLFGIPSQDKPMDNQKPDYWAGR